MISYAIVLIDDDPMVRDGVSEVLGKDYRIQTFGDAESGLESIKAAPPDLVLLDIALPGMNGIQALEKIKNLAPEIVVVMISAFDDIETVVLAMKSGAHDYLLKPIHMEDLEATIGNALDAIKLRKEVRELQEKFLRQNLPCFIGESNAIHDVMEFVKTIAKSPHTPVLILGETGTGKELIASAIHYRSPHFKNPFVPVNCASIPEDLIESELFGYERGAFSGASQSGKKGLIEEAAQGTLFLDEVGDLSPEAQAKLLRFLEDGKYYRLGSTKPVKIETRVVSATNKNLERMIAEGLFRKDLYYRLSVVKVEVPSLNHRREDILPIARHFLVEFSEKFEKRITGIAPEAERALQEFTWEGNVRELRNMIERAVLVAKSPELTLADMGIRPIEGIHEGGSKKADGLYFPALSSQGIDLSSITEKLERYYIEEALRISAGNESQAARLLNINHHTFRYRRAKLQIPG